MIGGFSLVHNKFRDCESWQEKLLWIVIVFIGFFVVRIPNWIDRKIHK